MIEEIDESLFISRFEDYKRITTSENQGNFTYKGLRALFEYLESIEDDENQIKLDVIALCCDYSEYKNLEEYLNNYKTTDEINQEIQELKESEDIEDEEELKKRYKQQIEEEINNNTTLIKFDDDLDEGFIIQQY